MFNTYGLRSINQSTFNTGYTDHLQYPREGRNLLVTALRVHNAVLNVLGYLQFLPVVSIVSGCLRMATGLAMLGLTVSIGDRNADEGAIIGRWYDEAVNMGVAQVARGALEAFVPYGWAVNIGLDVIGSVVNVIEPVADQAAMASMVAGEPGPGPYEEPEYPLALSWLNLV